MARRAETALASARLITDRSAKEGMLARTLLLVFGSLLAWLLYANGDEIGWMGGVVFGLAGIAIGLSAIIATSVITVIKMKKKEEQMGISLAFIATSVGLLAFGAVRMIKW